MNNSVAKREIEMALTLEAQNYAKWIEEFSALKDILEFVVLFGSIIKDEKSARDIDILIVADKREFNKINQNIKDKNRVLNKKIHLILQSKEDFRKDINNKNKVMVDIIKNGIILFGQEKLTKLLEKF
ncbi:MAG: nucleotidyltransferase domain-containing protein, partial [Nanoarchaeota archaeon]